MPVAPEQWDDSFRQVWATMSPETTMVRLGWCVFEENVGRLTWEVHSRGGKFRSITGTFRPDGGYYAGGCTTGYLVHTRALPDVLGLFPCCCPIDCCLEWGLFNRATPPGVRGPRGLTFMQSLDNSDAIGHWPLNWTSFNQSGILLQDNRRRKSSRPGCAWSWWTKAWICEAENPDTWVNFLLVVVVLVGVGLGAAYRTASSPHKRP